jgi:hypothetical protein
MLRLHPITKKSYDRADDYQPQPNRQYKWVWEYALFRFNRISNNVARAEDKALELLKFVIGLVAAIWALFAFFRPNLNTVHWLTEELAASALIMLFVSALCFLGAYIPVKRLSPVAEAAALRHADAYDNADAAVAKFSHQFASSTEYEKYLLGKKSGRIQIGVGLLFLAFTLFIFALFYETSHSGIPNPGPQGALILRERLVRVGQQQDSRLRSSPFGHCRSPAAVDRSIHYRHPSYTSDTTLAES